MLGGARRDVGDVHIRVLISIRVGLGLRCLRRHIVGWHAELFGIVPLTRRLAEARLHGLHQAATISPRHICCLRIQLPRLLLRHGLLLVVQHVPQGNRKLRENLFLLHPDV